MLNTFVLYIEYCWKEEIMCIHKNYIKNLNQFSILHHNFFLCFIYFILKHDFWWWWKTNERKKKRWNKRERLKFAYSCKNSLDHGCINIYLTKTVLMLGNFTSHRSRSVMCEKYNVKVEEEWMLLSLVCSRFIYA